MNKQETKKWFLLLSLLIITLILAWQAPEEEQQSEVVKAKPISVPDKSVTSAEQQDAEQESDLVSRQLAHSQIDLFDTPKRPKPIQPKVVEPIRQVKPVMRERVIAIPFKYIGRIEKNSGTTLFLMEDTLLHLVQTGDVINSEFKLVKIDSKLQQLEWLYLPSNKRLIMSMAK